MNNGKLRRDGTIGHAHLSQLSSCLRVAAYEPNERTLLLVFCCVRYGSSHHKQHIVQICNRKCCLQVSQLVVDAGLLEGKRVHDRFLDLGGSAPAEQPTAAERSYMFPALGSGDGAAAATGAASWEVVEARMQVRGLYVWQIFFCKKDGKGLSCLFPRGYLLWLVKPTSAAGWFGRFGDTI